MANLQKVTLIDGRVISCINKIDKVKLVKAPIDFAEVLFSLN